MVVLLKTISSDSYVFPSAGQSYDFSKHLILSDRRGADFSFPLVGLERGVYDRSSDFPLVGIDRQQRSENFAFIPTRERGRRTSESSDASQPRPTAFERTLRASVFPSAPSFVPRTPVVPASASAARPVTPVKASSSAVPTSSIRADFAAKRFSTRPATMSSKRMLARLGSKSKQQLMNAAKTLGALKFSPAALPRVGKPRLGRAFGVRRGAPKFVASRRSSGSWASSSSSDSLPGTLAASAAFAQSRRAPPAAGSVLPPVPPLVSGPFTGVGRPVVGGYLAGTHAPRTQLVARASDRTIIQHTQVEHAELEFEYYGDGTVKAGSIRQDGMPLSTSAYDDVIHAVQVSRSTGVGLPKFRKFQLTATGVSRVASAASARWARNVNERVLIDRPFTSGECCAVTVAGVRRALRVEDVDALYPKSFDVRFHYFSDNSVRRHTLYVNGIEVPETELQDALDASGVGFATPRGFSAVCVTADPQVLDEEANWVHVGAHTDKFLSASLLCSESYPTQITCRVGASGNVIAGTLQSDGSVMSDAEVALLIRDLVYGY